jgi:hypothetical protein
METAAKTVGGSSHWDLQRRSQCIGEPRNFWENKPQWWYAIPLAQLINDVLIHNFKSVHTFTRVTCSGSGSSSRDVLCL